MPEEGEAVPRPYNGCCVVFRVILGFLISQEQCAFVVYGAFDIAGFVIAKTD
jgi:hypothetical protein